MSQENTALLEALANIQEELALTLEELIDHNGDSMDDARRKRIDQLRARHWSDCAVYNEPHAPSGPCDCGGYLVSITTPTTDSLTADAAAVREAAAKVADDYATERNEDGVLVHQRLCIVAAEEIATAIRAIPLPAHLTAQRSQPGCNAQTVPADVAELVVAAREAVQCIDSLMPCSPDELQALDKALSPFASRVCWDDEGGSLTDAHADPCSCGKGGA